MAAGDQPPAMSPYAGMTVNERLFAAGLLYSFEEAAHAKDENAIRAILTKVDLGEEAANEIIEWVKSSPHSPYNK